MLKPLDPAVWSPRHARHLLNRAGFGVPRERVAAFVAQGPEAAVASLLEFPGTPDAAGEPDFLPVAGRAGQFMGAMASVGVAERLAIQQDKRQEEREAVQRLKAWWLLQMHRTAYPLQEKLALFWHGHFATSAQKVQASTHNYALNALFRGHAAGNFKALTTAVGQSAAMLHYLDNQRSTRAHPNENWARELMELFTLGQGQYSEADIKESARAFTGWSVDGEGAFYFQLASHDPGEKVFMGRRGVLDGWDVIDTIFAQEAVAPFICGKLWRYFAGTEPRAAVLEALAATFRAEDYALAPVLRELFLSEAFYEDAVVGAQIKSPAQFVIQLVEDLELETPPYAVMAQACRSLGQDLFQPPNVKGWDGNRAWINANTLLQRYNLPGRLALAARAVEHLQERVEVAEEGVMMSPEMLDAPSRDVLGRMQRSYRVELVAALSERMAELPADERARVWKTLRDGTPGERLAVVTSLGLPLPPELRDTAPDSLKGLPGETADAVVGALAERYLMQPLQPAQRRVLAVALGAEEVSAPLRAETVPTERLAAAFHLLTSLAEYQLS
jgi:uncharacterized protein (DUF1800 family)